MRNGYAYLYSLERPLVEYQQHHLVGGRSACDALHILVEVCTHRFKVFRQNMDAKLLDLRKISY